MRRLIAAATVGSFAVAASLLGATAASAAGTAHTRTGSTGRLGRQDVVSTLVDKPWSNRVGGHPVDTPAG